MICIISDTHDNCKAIESAMTDIRIINPDLIVHCGDITMPASLQLFAGFPMYLAFGNCDLHRETLVTTATSLGCVQSGDFLSFETKGKRFFVTHGHNSGQLDRAIQSGEYDYVLHGHTHLMRNLSCEKTRVINPGALHAVSQKSFAVLNCSADYVEFYRVL